MKRMLLGVLTVSLVVVAVALSDSATSLRSSSLFQVQVEARNPWTHLRGNDVNDFQFVVISDRTGGHREKVFSRAVEQINLLQPEFVLSVGDLIEGYTEDREQAQREWKEFQTFTSRLHMPFFYVAGNHDITNPMMQKLWEEKFGRRYYHFVYKNVLFLMLCTEDPPKTTNISDAQVEYALKAIADNPGVHWTVVALHKPIWTRDITKNGWGRIEAALKGRPYTVFAGHIHRYQKFVRNGMNYYQLATTGGISRVRGLKYGEFDHVVWVTMRKTGPVLANLMLDGIVREDLQPIETDESVQWYELKRTHPVKGVVYMDSTTATGATIKFHAIRSGWINQTREVADALVEADGSFVLTMLNPGDGAPVGDYKVTVVKDREYVGFEERPTDNAYPAKYAHPRTTPLKATVRTGPNHFTFELTSQP